MTVMGDALVEELSDAGSIPARSTKAMECHASADVPWLFFTEETQFTDKIKGNEYDETSGRNRSGGKRERNDGYGEIKNIGSGR